jgi:hypothetical protein
MGEFGTAANGRAAQGRYANGVPICTGSVQTLRIVIVIFALPEHPDPTRGAGESDDDEGHRSPASALESPGMPELQAHGLICLN